MSKKSRKLVGKPTGRVTKAGRPVLKTPQGEERSEYSATIKLDNGKYINIPTIHNGKYYTEDELKKAVEDNRMIPTSEHDSFEEAIEAAKKRSKTLKQGGVLKAHQGTIVYNQGEQPSTLPPMQGPPSKIDVEGPPARKEEIDVLDNPFQPPNNMMPGFGGSGVPPSEISNPIPASPLLEPPMPLDQIQPINQIQPIDQVQPTDQIKEDLKKLMPGYGGSGVNTMVRKDFGVPRGYFTTALPMNRPQPRLERTLLDFYKAKQRQKQLMDQRRNYASIFDRNFRNTDRFKKLQDERDAVRKAFEATDAFKTYKQKMQEQEEIYNKERMDAMKNFNSQFHGGNLFPGMGSAIGKQMAFNEGGAVMEKQMDFFMDGGMPEEKQLNFFDEGGMKDDGGEKDPVSGNDVPLGSLAKEVRDDVPAMVSEGEFIFPADVTRYIGLDRLMEMRQDAKMGLKKMEMMGQLGNPEDAELPDDIPFDAADIIVMDMDDEEVEEKNEGGVVGFQTGTADPAQTYSSITQLANQEYANRYSYYENDAGDKITILTNWRGEPLQAVPAGYKIMLNKDGSPVTEKPKSEEDKDNIEKTQPVTTQSAQQDNDPKDPMQMIEEGRKSAEVTAKRLGMDVDKYLALPIKTRFNLIGEELKVMRGAEPDLEKIEGIVNGTIKSGSGDGIFGFSLLGGIIDTLGTMLDRDGNGSMWSSTVLNPDGTGKEVDIFGNTIRTFTEKEMKSFGELVDGRWQGNLENPYSPKGSKGSGGSGGGSNKTKPTVSSTTTKFDAAKGFKDGKPQTARGKKADSDRYSAMAKSYQNKTPGYEKNKSDKNEFAKQTGGKPIESDATTAKEMGTGAGSYNPVTRSIAQKQQKENKTAKDITRDVMGGDLNKGKLIARPPTKKKPTKGKTLVTKRS